MSSSTNTLGKYQIVREIARSNDVVYEAIDPSLNRRIALKELFLMPNLTPAQKRERIERFHREGRAAGRLSHPNIVTIFEVGQEGDRYFIAMEFLEGQTLRDVIQMRGALPLKEAIDIALQVLDALAYAHRNGVVHRDIKPENIQILPGGHVKITDFGIARLMGESSITVDGQVFGTPSYMSPEQVTGKPLDQRSDLFSMGVVLYEMLAGKKPFQGDSVVTITYNIMNRETPPLPGIPPYLIAIVNKAMAKDPDQRYSSADEMAADLKNETAPGGAFAQIDPFGVPSAANGTTCIGSSLPPPPNGGYPPPPLVGSQGSYQPSSSPALDPFSQPAPAPSYSPPVPRAPRKPILSPESSNFLGIFFLVLGLTGMLIFAIWAVSVAYKSFEESVGSQQAAAYMEQGRRLFNEGKYQDAEEQFKHALRVAPKGESAEKAKKSLAAVYVNQGVKELNAGNLGGAHVYAQQAIDSDPKSPGAHLLAGVIYSRTGKTDRAIQEWQLTIDADPTSNDAKIARENLGTIYYNQGMAYYNAGQQDKAIESWQRVTQDCAGTNIAQLAQQRLDEAMGIGHGHGQ